jgi:PadR family transcriptional regulator
MSKIQGDALRGHLDNLVLAVLARGPAHGLEVLRRLEAAGCGALALKEGTLYPALYRLEESGLLKATWENDAAREKTGGRGPRKRIYTLTSKGQRQLVQGREEFQRFTQVIGGILGVAS